MRVLVTGGGGFLGGAIVRRLRARGDTVRSISRGEHTWLAELGVEHTRADITDADAVKKSAEGCDIVFHVAAKAGIWGDPKDYEDANVAGTENVLAACREHGITKLVYTSSPSVTFNGEDQDGVDESAPYPTRWLADYPRTKAQAEKQILQVNSANLATVSLRPHLIWGPNDNHLVPRIIARAKAGQLRLVGKEDKLVDSVYIDNAADAHLLAADSLAPDAAHAGKAYFISNGEPMSMADLINGILAAAHLPPVTRRVPAGVAYAAGAIMELAYTMLGKRDEPRMTRFLARQLSTAHWFRIEAAERDFGYEPKVPIKEGLKRLEEHLKNSDKPA